MGKINVDDKMELEQRNTGENMEIMFLHKHPSTR